MKTTYSKGSFAFTAVLMIMTFASPASGATASDAELSAAQGSGLSEIVVTAQKREQKLTDVGLTVLAASGAQLADAGVSDVTSLAKVAPGFAVGTTYTGTQVFSLRGINFNATQISAAPAVSTYIDEAILPYSAMTGGLLLDVERVEILKGPQGTLFGQNATGGSVNVIAAKPTSTFTAGMHGEVNNFGQLMTEGYVSGPLADALRARFAAATTQFGDWQRGYYLDPGQRNAAQNKLAARLLLDYTPTDRLTIRLNLNGNYDHGELQQPQVGLIKVVVPGAEPPGFAAYLPASGDRQAEFDPGLNTHKRDRLYQATLRADYQLTHDLTLTSLTNYADFETRHTLDGDATVFNEIEYFPRGNIRTIGQELRLTGKTLDGRLNYIVGGNYQKDNITDANDLVITSYSAIPPGTSFSTPNHLTNRAAGIFANADYEVVKDVTLTGGARYTDTRQTLQGCTSGSPVGTAIAGAIGNALRAGAGLPPTNAFVPGECLTIGDTGAAPNYLPTSPDLSQKESNVSWRAGINYKPQEDTLIYVLASRGYKTGVFPVTPAELILSGLKPVTQEKLTSYEVGTKLGLLDRRLQLNLAAYYYDYSNKQFLSYVPYPIVAYNQVLQNVPTSRAMGVDMDLVAKPTRGLTLRAAVSYLDSRVGNFVSFTPDLVYVNVKGSQFNFAPPWSGTLDAEYKFHLRGDLALYVGASGQGNSRTFSDLGEDPKTKIPGYMLFDARAGVSSDTGWTVGVFVRNLSDKYYWTSVYRTADTYARYAGVPRTFGANIDYRF